MADKRKDPKSVVRKGELKKDRKRRRDPLSVVRPGESAKRTPRPGGPTRKQREKERLARHFLEATRERQTTDSNNKR